MSNEDGPILTDLELYHLCFWIVVLFGVFFLISWAW